MTTSTGKITLPGLSFCAYPSKPQSQPDVARLKQDLTTALKTASGFANKLEGPARAEAFRMIYEAEQALSAVSKGTTNLKEFPTIANNMIQKLESFPKLFQINGEAAKSGLRSAREKITSANLPQKAPEKAKSSYQAGPAGGSPEPAGRAYQQHAGKAQAKAAEKPTLAERIAVVKETEQMMKEAIAIETMRFAGRAAANAFGAMMEAQDRSEPGLSERSEQAVAAKDEGGLAGAFTRLAEARCAAEAAAHSPLGTQTPGTREVDLSKGKYSLMGSGAALTVLLAGPPAAAHAEAWADLRLIEAQMRNARAAERLYSFPGVEPPPKVTPERASARSNLQWKERQSKFVQVFSSMVKSPRAGGITAFVLQGIGIARDAFAAYNNAESAKEEGKEPGSDLIA